MSQNSHRTATKDTFLREEIDLVWQFLKVSQNSYNTAGGDTSLREEIGLGGKFKGVTKFTQYSTASVQQLGDKQAERRPMREELGSRFARTSSCRHLVQFLAKFDQKCLLTDLLHRLASHFARTSSVSLEKKSCLLSDIYY